MINFAAKGLMYVFLKDCIVITEFFAADGAFFSIREYRLEARKFEMW